MDGFLTSRSPRMKGRRLGRTLCHPFGVLAAFLSGIVLLLSADAAQTHRVGQPDPPTTNIVDYNIIWARNPDEKAKLVEIDASLMEQCRESRFVVVTSSGTACTK